MNKLYAIRVALEKTLQSKSVSVYTWIIDYNTKRYPIGVTNKVFYDAQVCRVVLFNYFTSPQLGYSTHRVIINDESIEKNIHKEPNDFVQELKAIHELEYPFFLTTNPSTFYNVLRNTPMLLLDKIQINGSSINVYQHKFLIKIRELLSN
jgi:hypothetical protein